MGLIEDICLSYLIGFVLTCFVTAITICLFIMWNGNQEVSVETGRVITIGLFTATLVIGSVLLKLKR